MSFKPKNVLVTGGAGFIGSNYVKMLTKKKPPPFIVTLDKLTYAGDKHRLSGLSPVIHHFILGDIKDSALITELLKKYDIDTVVHFAAESHVDNSISNPKLFVETNIIGTFTLLEACRNFWLFRHSLNPERCRFHHISTDEVYGSLSKEDSPFRETDRYQPSSPYSASKASSDHLVHAYFHTYQLPITVSNCSNNYGPFQHHEKFIPKIITACLKQSLIPIYGNGSNIRDWLYVEDHCSAIDLIITTGNVGETYNIGGNNEFDNLTLVKIICKEMDQINPHHAPHEKLITFIDDRKGHDWRYAIDNQKIKDELGFEETVNFSENIRKTIYYYIRSEKIEQHLEKLT